MSIIQSFNNKLNQSFTKRSSVNLSFSKQVDIILNSTLQKNKNFRQALIIGAGKMEDFSLYFFTKYFDKVVITDIDTLSVSKVVNEMKLSKSERKKIIIKEVEYTGFEKANFFSDFRSEIYKISTFDAIDKFLETKFEEIKDYEFLKNDFRKYDFIYVSPIYTQLIYNQILLECSLLREGGYQENLLKYIENVILDEMVNIINRFNSNIVHLMGEYGKLFVLSDIFEVNVGSEFDLRITSGIKDRNIMDHIYEQYTKKYGMGLGDFGLYNLDEKINAGIYKWLKWPFKDNTNLIIKLKIYEKSKLNKEVKL
ncbi:hypothetical protein KQ51_01017 [Candidatus Izimaplasma bacterium HR1]|jgi:hypothetical protein|uniref:hypothetical protein n=1 Tax=Candidatus Izimoplasma sp. HR1 TaxID=1541959 RepID=UPI0004F5D8F2|nr:hypothetical protein KQ51_01017 [Candidatus Izimaplasma bacterium HR1]